MERFCTPRFISTRHNHQCQRTFQQRLPKICMYVFEIRLGYPIEAANESNHHKVRESIRPCHIFQHLHSIWIVIWLCCVTIIGLNQQRWLTLTYNFENKTWEIVFQNLDQIACLSPVLNEPDGSLQASFDYSLWKYKRWLSRRNRSTKLQRKQSH